MIGYPPHAPGYRVYNSETRRITTSVHVVFHENTPGFGTGLPIESVIADSSDDGSPHDTSPISHPIDTPVRSSTTSYSPASCSTPVAPTPLRGPCGPHVRLPADTCHGVL
jgi:hypothetical protein